MSVSFESKTHKGKEGTFFEEGTLVHEGKKFTSGGSHIGINKKTGKMGGILYAYEKEKKVGTWDGKQKYPATFARGYRDNFGGTRQTVYFKINGKTFTGTYFKSQGDIVRFREVSPKNWGR